MLKLVLAASSASALVIGVPLTVTNMRALAPEMQAWDAFGIGRKTAVPMGGISAWDEVGNEVVTPPKDFHPHLEITVSLSSVGFRVFSPCLRNEYIHI